MKVLDWDGLVALVNEVVTRLQQKVSVTRTVNRKALVEDITLDAEDVGAIAGVQRNNIDLEADENNKVNVQVPERVSELVNDAGYITQFEGSTVAEKLQTARNIGITTGVTGIPTPFDGSEDINIPVTAVNADYFTNGDDTLVLYCGDASS